MPKSKRSDSLRYCSVDLMWLPIGVVLAVLVTTLGGCPKVQTEVPTYQEARRQALKEAPFVQEPIERRHKLPGCADKPKVLVKNPAHGIPHTGLLITNQKAACLVARTAERDRLRLELEAERLRARTKQIIDDAAYKRLAEAARRSWWDRHKLSVLAPTLVAIGGALVLGVVYCLTGGKPINVSTNVYVKP